MLLQYQALAEPVLVEAATVAPPIESWEFRSELPFLMEEEKRTQLDYPFIAEEIVKFVSTDWMIMDVLPQPEENRQQNDYLFIAEETIKNVATDWFPQVSSPLILESEYPQHQELQEITPPEITFEGIMDWLYIDMPIFTEGNNVVAEESRHILFVPLDPLEWLYPPQLHLILPEDRTSITSSVLTEFTAAAAPTIFLDWLFDIENIHHESVPLHGDWSYLTIAITEEHICFNRTVRVTETSARTVIARETTARTVTVTETFSRVITVPIC